MTDTAFFILAKLVGLGLRLESWLVLGLLTTLIAGRFSWTRLTRWSGRLTMIGLLSLTLLPVGDLILRPLEAEFPPRTAPLHVDGIIILGGMEDPRPTQFWGPPQVNASAERLTLGAELARAHPKAQVIFSGTTGRMQALRLSDAPPPPLAIEFLASLGLAPSRVQWEPNSRNTAENARLSYAMVQPDAQEQWVLVTSAFHMGRALSSFEAAGWPAMHPMPTDYRSADFASGLGWDLAHNLQLANMGLKEWVGRLAYRAAGR